MKDGVFHELVAEVKRIKGLFMGHTHLCHVIDLGEEFNNKTIAQLGNNYCITLNLLFFE